MKPTKSEKQAKSFKEAEKELAFMRSDLCTHLCNSIPRFREMVKAAGCKLADLGTNNEELEYLKRQHYKNEAVYWLHGALDKYPSPSIDYVEHIRDSLTKGGWTLEDIGWTKRRLINLEKRMNKRIATNLLQKARSDPYDSLTARDIERFVIKAGCTLADIGTSKEEVNKLSEPICWADRRGG